MRIRSSLIRNLLWGVAVVALVLVAYGYRTGVRIRSADKAPVAEGLVLVDTLGAAVDLGSMSGRIVVVNLWASWCGFCRMEIPSLRDLQRKYREQGVTVLGVNLEEGGSEELLARVRDLEIDYPVARPVAPLSGPFAGGSALPHTWIVDRQGRVRASHSGYASGRSLEKAVEKLLRED
jgi:thiol-disulfide isomerase/thioredoxin